MQLTTFTDYGLRTLMYLAGNMDKTSSVKEISEYYGISRNHLVKVVHRLSVLGYIATTKGKGGGIRLAHDPDGLRLGVLVKNLEPHMNCVECFAHETNTCRITDICKLKHYLADAVKSFLDTLNQYTLADTVKSKKMFYDISG